MSLSTYEQQRFYTRAAERLQQGYTQTQIAAELEKEGVSGDDAQTIIDRLIAANQSVQELQNKDKNKKPYYSPVSANQYQAARQSDADAALRSMAAGAVICIIGILITAGTYSAAASRAGGGTYFVAYGAVIGGGIQFFRGLYAYMNS